MEIAFFLGPNIMKSDHHEKRVGIWGFFDSIKAAAEECAV